MSTTESRRTAVVAMSLFLAAGVAVGATRDFDFDWRFSKGDFATAMVPAFDDSGWHTVNVPHDWSVEGPFSADYASGTGYAPGGIGWYRKHFILDAADKDKRIAIEFDGVYHNSEVWINGQFIGRRPYGYSSFEYDLTGFLKSGHENILAVRVDHAKFADSRWYTGSGIYRHVRLHVGDKLHVGRWGVYVTTPEVTDDAALIRIETTVKNDYADTREFSLQSTILTPDGREAAGLTTSGDAAANEEKTLTSQIRISQPQLWLLESPALYTLRSRVLVREKVVAEVTTPFGIRTIRFDPDKGFFLNGQSMKLKGVCLHHDAGCLGAAVPDKVLERRLRLMKELGANAIRTSHNPPAPELLDICDRLGLLVMDEAFDEFTPPKNKWTVGWNAGQPSKFGYGEVFAQWSAIDAADMVRRDRNHPCIIMWSIGNEIDYANDPFSHPVLGNEYRPENPPAENLVKYAKPLVETVKRWDRTRPVTMALANTRMSNAVGLPELLDVVGYNYQEQYYQADHQTYPKRFIYGSENGDAHSAWTAVQDNDYVAGQFLWTGIDYLGEASRFPNRANGTGLLDMCGFKKPLAWFRQSLWSDEPMVYVYASARGAGRGGRGRGMRGRESWNWSEGATVTVIGHTNCPEVTLTLNDKPVGTRSLSEARQGALMWQVPYEPGILRAVGRTDGKDACEFTLRTAGAAKRITLSPDAVRLTADGKDICHLVFQITDDSGVRVPDADHEVTFDVDGPAEIIGIENGDLSSLEDPKDHVHKAYQGQGLVILQAARQGGTVRVTARAEGLAGTSPEINVVPTTRYVITEYGAVGNGRTVNTKAIQSAIDTCASDGGGTVVVPAGTFVSGAIFLKQGVNLHIERDGVLKAVVDRSAFPQVDSRWEGVEQQWISAFVNAFDTTGFTLTGEGMIDGSGDVWLREMHPRPRLIAIQSCKDVKVSGLSIKNQACWGLFILYSENVEVANLTIRAEYNIAMSDGIDVDSSKNVHITGCDIDTNDDCIAIKSGKDEDGRRVNRPAEDILVENCRFRYGHGGVSMGSEMSGGIRNVEVRNCVMDSDNWAPIRFKSQPSRGGVVENITYRDIQLNGTRKAFEFNMEWRMVNPKPPSDPLPVVRNVKIINVSGTTRLVGDMHGLKDSPISSVTFENCHITAQRGFTIDNVVDLDLSGLAITVEQGEPIIRRDAR